MRYLCVIILIVSHNLYAQNCPFPGSTPLTAIAVCGTTTFTQVFFPSCLGPDIPQGINICPTFPVTSSNSVWYKFHCYQSGKLGFLITPTSNLDDYDWEVMNITNRRPEAVLYAPNLMMSLNLSGQTGVTGCTATGKYNIRCEGGGPTSQFNKLIDLVVGGDYLLMVTNWTNSGIGYDLNFYGTAKITNGLPPALESFNIDTCNNSTINLVFNEELLCTSLTNSGSEFTLTDANLANTYNITSVNSGCNSSSSFKRLSLGLQSPLAPGDYLLTIKNGIDNNTLLDICEEALPEIPNIYFTINPITPLGIKSISSIGCTSKTLRVVFNHPILCSSITALGSEFSIIPPAGNLPIASVYSKCYEEAVYVDTLIINLQNPLLGANYLLEVNNGTDGNTFIDNCDNLLPQGYTFPFTIITNQPPTYDYLQFDKCSPSVIKVFYSRPVKCNSINASANEFSITGPTTVNISSVLTDSETCNAGYTNWVQLNLSQPINNTGDYVLHNIVGADGNSVLDTCLVAQNLSETISFKTFYKPSAAFTGVVKLNCTMDTLLLSHAGGNGIISWQWNFSDGTTLFGQNVLKTFPLTTFTTSVQLIVSNGICKDSLTKSFAFDNAFNPAFTISSDTICRNSNVIFINNTSGNIVQYIWQYGDNTNFIGENSPTHSYILNGIYNVNLIVKNNYGCIDTVTKKITVTDLPKLSFTGLKNFYCTGDTVSLAASVVGNIADFSWSLGNNLSIQNQMNIKYQYRAQGNYVVTLTVNDKYCGVFKKDSTAIVYKLPVFDLGSDLILCPDIIKKIGVVNNNYSYLWNTGATTSTILTAVNSNLYKLTVNNNGCIVSDAIYVDVLSNCLIKVPTAFSPNNDGKNDMLKAINADLATHFSFKIYNRYGELIFASENPLQGWDGKYNKIEVPPGTYVWQLSYIDHFSKRPVLEKGTSILIR
jgi:gliding motility-associated-like protein